MQLATFDPTIDRLPPISLDADADAARAELAGAATGTVELARPSLDALPYRGLIEQMLQKPGFRMEFNRQAPAQAIDMLADQLLGPGSWLRERALLAADIAALGDLMGRLTGAPAMIAVRSYFAPGDLVWHVDRFAARSAFRLVWPIGRRAGMRVTGTDNIDMPMYRAFMRREYPLLCQMDSVVGRTGVPVEQLWAHRPAQLQAMRDGVFPFLRDPAREWEVTPGAASIHRVETPSAVGTFHRSSWANRQAPGFQVIVTAASDIG